MHDALEGGQTSAILIAVHLPEHEFSYYRNSGSVGKPLEVSWNTPKDFELGETRWQLPDIIKYKNLSLYGYQKDFHVLYPFTVADKLAPGEYSLKALITWSSCDKVCALHETAVNIPITIAKNSKASTLFANKLVELKDKFPRENVPLVIDQVTQDQWLLHLNSVHTRLSWNKAAFLPHKQRLSLTNDAAYDDSGKLAIKVRSYAGSWSTLPQGIVVFFDSLDHAVFGLDVGASGTQINANAIHEQSSSWYYILWLAVLGGLVLNIMPCVFPVLMLKICGLATAKSKAREQAITDACYYMLSTVVSFTMLGLFIWSMRQFGSNMSWGYQMQSETFLAIASMVFFIFALNMYGYLLLPGFSFILREKSGVLDKFIPGVITVITAAPCLAPFMTIAVGFALTTTNFYMAIAVFACLGLGLGFPYFLCCIIPSLTSLVPSPGAWLFCCRKVCAGVFLLLSFSLLYILFLQKGIAAVSFLLIALLGITAIAILKEHSRVSFWLLYLAIITISFNILLHFTTGIAKQDNVESLEALERHLQQHQRVFVNVTASWCLLCQLNENLVFNSNELKNFFQQQGIFYRVLDVSMHNNKVDNFMHTFNHYGVPLYLFYDSEGLVTKLPQDITISKIKSVAKAAK